MGTKTLYISIYIYRSSSHVGKFRSISKLDEKEMFSYCIPSSISILSFLTYMRWPMGRDGIQLLYVIYTENNRYRESHFISKIMSQKQEGGKKHDSFISVPLWKV